MEHDAARQLVVERGLVGPAFAHLTDAFLTLPFERLGPVKTLLKRYLSAEPWGPEDDDALAAAVGPGDGWWRRDLDTDLALEFGWVDGRFQVAAVVQAGDGVRAGSSASPVAEGLGATFDGPVVPEATPNPRTIRFGFGHPIHDGPSRWFDSAAAATDTDDARVARLFGDFDRVANVLVGPDFVAVGLRRADDWEILLAPVLAVVTEEFADPEEEPGTPSGAATGPPWLAGGRTAPAGGEGRRLTRLEQAWRDLGSLRPADAADDLAEVVAAATAADPFRRQVAANLLGEADPGTAVAQWSRLVADPARGVRRATVDAMVDAGRDELRPLLEAALGDTDAWVRWKALRGLAELGPAPSRAAISAKADDPDFRVRLEAAAALRGA